MRVLMLTNVFTPLVGGITRSIQLFTEQLRSRGHEVVIVAPDHEEELPPEEGVVRYPAIPRFYKDRYSLPLPTPGFLSTLLDEFRPEVMHSHHPFLLGSTAQRTAVFRNVPLVYTHHTNYKVNMELATDAPQSLIEFIIRSGTLYCNACDGVIAPSGAIAEMLRRRGVTTPITVIPTGVDVDRFREGDRAGFRHKWKIPAEAYLLGYLGRLDPEKNLGFLQRVVVQYLHSHPEAHWLVVGDGRSRPQLEEVVEQQGLTGRVHLTGSLSGQDVVDAYHAMDVFVFSSHSETQGMVLTETMAAGTPVVAVSAVGVDDVVRDGENGRMLPEDDEHTFLEALAWMANRTEEDRRGLQQAARQTAVEFSLARCTDRLLDLYNSVSSLPAKQGQRLQWAMLNLLNYEWNAWSNLMNAAGETFLGGHAPTDENQPTHR